ncbi:MAG: hypothetical protein FWE71_03590 [Nocardioidaceae bacterium]|nr:hypothetical protein [Nocardioidaceae bacterium]MCL2614166.1 hypothetical protein [Nocardioidaceae bacterium]
MLVAHLLPLLPQRLRVLLARRVLGWEIHPTASLGRSTIAVGRLVMGPDSSIGPRNTIRGLEELVLERGATIGGENWINGYPPGFFAYQNNPDRRSSLHLGEYASITTGHRVDCSDAVVLDHHASLVGFGTVVLTHSLSIRTNHFRVAPVRIGHHATVMNGCTVFVGVEIAPQAVISAASVVAQSLEKPCTLYRGNPAEAVRELDPAGELLSRPGHYGNGPAA